MPTVYTEVEIDVELNDFDTEDLVEELESRGALPVEGSDNAKDIVEQMYLLRRLGKPYDHLVDRLFYSVLGRVV
jgi:hypothetical protein